jgi:hypothetical protein
MNWSFLISFVRKVYRGFTEPREIKLSRHEGRYILCFHKLSKSEVRQAGPVCVFFLIAFAVAPLLFAGSVVRDATSALTNDFSLWEALQAVIGVPVVIGFFYVMYHLFMSILFGSTLVYLSESELVIDEGNLGYIPIDKTRIQKEEMTEVCIRESFLSGRALYVIANGKTITLVKSRPESDMQLIRDILRTYMRSTELSALDTYV